MTASTQCVRVAVFCPTNMFNKILVANRSEIAIRVYRAARELHIRSVGIYSAEDRLTLHRFNTRESYRVGEGKGPIEAYLDMEDIIRVAWESGADDIHPGYGFLSENPEFAQLCADSGITINRREPELPYPQAGTRISSVTPDGWMFRVVILCTVLWATPYYILGLLSATAQDSTRYDADNKNQNKKGETDAKSLSTRRRSRRGAGITRRGLRPGRGRPGSNHIA